MNSKTRVLAALLGGPVDRPPVTGIVTAVTQDMMRETRAPWPDAHRDPELMAKLGAGGHALYGLETVKVPFDVTIEAEALGGEVNYGDRNVFPQLRGPFLKEPSQFEFPPDFLKRGRVPVVLQAIRLLREGYGAKVPVVSSVMGPFTLCTLCFGEEFFVWLKCEPEKYQQAMERATALACRYAAAQVIAGAEVIQFGEAAASGSMISPKDYSECVAPFHRQLAAAVGAPTVLHICGDITDRLERIGETGMSAISFDHRVDLAVAKRLKGHIALVGNIPVEVLAHSSPEEVRQCARQALQNGIDLLNAGCSLLTQTPAENLKQMIAASRDLSVAPQGWTGNQAH
jgi:[methyl-Co(III) methanol-specific corrinoid protein]:coenzyme M methyltransferase